jgi:hypothetical protein
MIRYRMDARLSARVDSSDVVQDCLTTAHLRLPAHLQGRKVLSLDGLDVYGQRRGLQRRHDGSVSWTDHSLRRYS